MTEDQFYTRRKLTSSVTRMIYIQSPHPRSYTYSSVFRVIRDDLSGPSCIKHNVDRIGIKRVDLSTVIQLAWALVQQKVRFLGF